MIRVVVRDGVTAASVRSVAAEAGWSTGSLRYYFPAQAELREFAGRVVAERVERRIRADLAGRDAESTLLERLASVVEQLIPLDDERREEYQWWLAVAEWQRQGERTEAAWLWGRQRDLYRQIAYRLAGFRDEPLPPATELHPEVERWAEYLHVFVDGLAAQAMFVPADMPAERVRLILRDFLERVPLLADARSGEDADAAGTDQQADYDEDDPPENLPTQ